MSLTRILILGAAGRDFHNFNVLYREVPHTRVRYELDERGTAGLVDVLEQFRFMPAQQANA